MLSPGILPEATLGQFLQGLPIHFISEFFRISFEDTSTDTYKDICKYSFYNIHPGVIPEISFEILPRIALVILPKIRPGVLQLTNCSRIFFRHSPIVTTRKTATWRTLRISPDNPRRIPQEFLQRFVLGLQKILRTYL